MNSTTRWTAQRRPIRCIRNAIFPHRRDCRPVALPARIKRTFIKTKRTTRSIGPTVAIGRHLLGQHTQSRAQIKHTSTSARSTKRKTMCSDHRRMVQSLDRFRRNCDQFHPLIRPFSMNATNQIPQTAIIIIRPAAFPSIRKTVRCQRDQYRRDQSKRTCIKRKHRTQRTQYTDRRAMNIHHEIVSFQWILRHTQVRQPNRTQTFTNTHQKLPQEMFTNENRWYRDHPSQSIMNHHKSTEHRQKISDNCWPRLTM